MSTVIYHYPGPQHVCKAVTIWGRLSKRGPKLVGSRMLCGHWKCPRCAPIRLEQWFLRLCEEIQKTGGFWIHRLTPEEVAKTSKQRKTAPERVGGWSRCFVTEPDRNGKTVTVISTERLRLKRKDLPAKWITAEKARDPSVHGPLIRILCSIKRREKKNERLVYGTNTHACPELERRDPDDYEYIGIGPNPDAAHRELQRHGIESQTTEEQVKVDEVTGKEQVVTAWGIQVPLTTAVTEDLVKAILGIRPRRVRFHETASWDPNLIPISKSRGPPAAPGRMVARTAR